MLQGSEHLQIREFEGRFYLYCGYQNLIKNNSKPLCFDSDGSFVSSVGSIGNSSNEYINIKDLMINEATRQVIIVDYNRFLFHTLDGKFIKSVDVKMNSLFKFSIFCNGSEGFVYLKNPSYIDGDVSWGEDFLVKLDSTGVEQSKFSLERKFLYQTGTTKGTIRTSVGSALLKSMDSLYVYISNDTLYRFFYSGRSQGLCNQYSVLFLQRLSKGHLLPFIPNYKNHSYVL